MHAHQVPVNHLHAYEETSALRKKGGGGSHNTRYAVCTRVNCVYVGGGGVGGHPCAS